MNYAVIRNENTVLFRVCFGFEIVYINLDFVIFETSIASVRDGDEAIVVLFSDGFANVAVCFLATVNYFLSFAVCEMKTSDYGIAIFDRWTVYFLAVLDVFSDNVPIGMFGYRNKCHTRDIWNRYLVWMCRICKRNNILCKEIPSNKCGSDCLLWYSCIFLPNRYLPRSPMMS